MKTRRREQSGSALLAVLWLSAALTAIAFSVATTVRSETERTGTSIDQLRAYYLATGAIDRAILWIYRGPGIRGPDGKAKYWENGMSMLRMEFPTGVAEVELIPEASKLNVNTARPVELIRLMVAAGADPARAEQIMAAIADWRLQLPPQATTELDQYYLSLTPSFRARHASFEQIEELLFVKGMTPELFYGTWTHAPDGRFVPVGGLKDCLSVFGPNEGFDVNTIHPALMISLGVPPEAVPALLQRRATAPFRNIGEAVQYLGGAAGRFRVGGNSIYTLRATSTIRLQTGQLSDVRKSVAALVKFDGDPGALAPYQILRWYDDAGTR
jgi:general secretion pathway protein K